MKTVYVFAGNLDQFWFHIRDRMADAKTVHTYLLESCAEVDGVTFQYCRDANALLGKHGVEVEFWGTVAARKDYDDLVSVARYARWA